MITKELLKRNTDGNDNSHTNNPVVVLEDNNKLQFKCHLDLYNYTFLNFLVCNNYMTCSEKRDYLQK